MFRSRNASDPSKEAVSRRLCFATEPTPNSDHWILSVGSSGEHALQRPTFKVIYVRTRPERSCAFRQAVPAQAKGRSPVESANCCWPKDGACQGEEHDIERHPLARSFFSNSDLSLLLTYIWVRHPKTFSSLFRGNHVRAVRDHPRLLW